MRLLTSTQFQNFASFDISSLNEKIHLQEENALISKKNKCMWEELHLLVQEDIQLTNYERVLFAFFF